MKTTILFLGLFITISCFSQNKKYLYKGDIPNLVLNDSLPEKYVIKDIQIRDSLRVFFQVIVDFENPLRDTTQVINVKTVTIWNLLVKSLCTDEKVINFLSEEELETDYQKYLWDLCNELLNFWYRNQPYKDISLRDLDKDLENRIIFSGTVYIEPL